MRIRSKYAYAVNTLGNAYLLYVFTACDDNEGAQESEGLRRKRERDVALCDQSVAAQGVLLTF